MKTLKFFMMVILLGAIGLLAFLSIGNIEIKNNFIVGFLQNLLADIIIVGVIGFLIELINKDSEKQKIRKAIFRGIKAEIDGNLQAIKNNRVVFQSNNAIGSFVVRGYWDVVKSSGDAKQLFDGGSRLNELVILYERIRVAQIHEENFVEFFYQVPRFPRGRKIKAKQIEKFKHDILVLYRDIEIDAEKILNSSEFKEI